MSVYDDQEEDWFANDCKGSPSDYDGCGNIGEWSDLQDEAPVPVKVRTEAQKERKRRSRRRRFAKKHAAQKAEASL